MYPHLPADPRTEDYYGLRWARVAGKFDLANIERIWHRRGSFGSGRAEPAEFSSIDLENAQYFNPLTHRVRTRPPAEIVRHPWYKIIGRVLNRLVEY